MDLQKVEEAVDALRRDGFCPDDTKRSVERCLDGDARCEDCIVAWLKTVSEVFK